MLENTESQEMYLTTIYALQKKNGMVRSVDVADERGYSKVSVHIVTYRLDKMESVKVEELERESHPEYELFNTEEYRKQVFSMFGGESQNITLLFTANILSDMFDRFGDDIRIKKADEETYSVDVTVQISKTFFAWIVGTQGKVKIKSPRKVIDEFKSERNARSVGRPNGWSDTRLLGVSWVDGKFQDEEKIV